jgi:hypothetical protein
MYLQSSLAECFYPDEDITGGDLSSKINIATLKDCQSLCSSTNDCCAWTWGKPTNKDIAHVCYLKTTNGNRSKYIHTISGTNDCKGFLFLFLEQ